MELVLGISGASGAVYGICTIEILAKLGIRTHVIVSKTAERTIYS
jgi:4-hydroxy-3-polyprenylbenzoate decarboxylase